MDTTVNTNRIDEVDDPVAVLSDNNRTEPRWDYGKNSSHTDEEYDRKLETKKNQWTLLRKESPPTAASGGGKHVNSDGFFCEAPSK